jgi:hypothetical protein
VPAGSVAVRYARALATSLHPAFTIRADAILALEKPKAAGRKVQAKGEMRERKKVSSEKLSQEKVDNKRASAQAAKSVGMSWTIFERTKKVVENGDREFNNRCGPSSRLTSVCTGRPCRHRASIRQMTDLYASIPN